MHRAGEYGKIIIIILNPMDKHASVHLFLFFFILLLLVYGLLFDLLLIYFCLVGLIPRFPSSILADQFYFWLQIKDKLGPCFRKVSLRAHNYPSISNQNTFFHQSHHIPYSYHISFYTRCCYHFFD